MGKRIVVTGGSGKAGRHVIPALLAQGHEVLNLDLVPLPDPLNELVHTVSTDLTNGGQVWSAMLSHFKLTEPFPQAEPRPDAVIHLAGVARNMLVPDNETFRVNTISTFNVLEAACRLGIRKVILASSICVYGVTYADGKVDFPSFPIHEELDTNPMDVYALSKVCVERTGRSFAMRFGVDVYALRIGAIISPDEYDKIFSSYTSEVSKWYVHGWSYVDARDLGNICHLCVMKDGLGFQVFNAVNDSITNKRSTNELLKELYPHTPFTRELGEEDAPITNQKLKSVLGFTEEHTWQNYYSSA